MKKINDTEPKDKNSYSYFLWLKRENIRQLRKAGHKADNIGAEPRKRKRFAAPDESKIRSIDSHNSYSNWIELHQGPEPIEANPDLWEDNQNKTVDGD